MLALVKLGFSLAEIEAMPEEAAIGWLKAAIPEAKNKKFIVRKKKAVIPACDLQVT